MTTRNTTLKVINEKEQTYSVETDVDFNEVLHSTNDEWLWDIASDMVSKHTGEIVIVSDPQYTPIKINQDGTIKIKIDCYLE